MTQRNCRICNKFFSPRWKKQLQCSSECSVEASKRGLPKVRDGKPPRKSKTKYVPRTLRKERQAAQLLKKYQDNPEVLKAIEESDELRALITSQMVDDRNSMVPAETNVVQVIHMDAYERDIEWLETKIAFR